VNLDRPDYALRRRPATLRPMRARATRHHGGAPAFSPRGLDDDQHDIVYRVFGVDLDELEPNHGGAELRNRHRLLIRGGVGMNSREGEWRGGLCCWHWRGVSARWDSPTGRRRTNPHGSKATPRAACPTTDPAPMRPSAQDPGRSCPPGCERRRCAARARANVPRAGARDRGTREAASNVDAVS